MGIGPSMASRQTYSLILSSSLTISVNRTNRLKALIMSTLGSLVVMTSLFFEAVQVD